jgi:hypothetical protein
MKTTSLSLFRVFILALLLLAALPVTALAQSQAPEFRLDDHRDFGYGAGENIGGSFSFTIYGDQSKISAVTYMMDGKEMASISQPPFKFSFKTSNYPSGAHTFYAVVKTTDGRSVNTPEFRRNFLSAAQQSEATQRILIPVVSGVVVLMLIGFAIQFLVLRRNTTLEPGAPRQYGLRGGTICPRCGRAYAMHMFSLHVGPWNLERCDFCGKWAWVTRRSQAELAAAEAAERTALQASESSLPAVQQTQESEAERLKKLLDESKYQ